MAEIRVESNVQTINTAMMMAVMPPKMMMIVTIALRFA
jgi:hypothetical protein